MNYLPGRVHRWMRTLMQLFLQQFYFRRKTATFYLNPVEMLARKKSSYFQLKNCLGVSKLATSNKLHSYLKFSRNQRRHSKLYWYEVDFVMWFPIAFVNNSICIMKSADSNQLTCVLWVQMLERQSTHWDHLLSYRNSLTCRCRIKRL